MMCIALKRPLAFALVFAFVLAAALASSCAGGKGGAGSARQAECEAIYKLVIERAEKYDGGRISADRELIAQPIDSGSLSLIRRGLRHFTIETEKAIGDYDSSGSADSEKALKSANRTSAEGAKYRLSRIGFNELMNIAVLYELDNINPELGHGSFIFLSKDAGGWAIDSEIMM